MVKNHEHMTDAALDWLEAKYPGDDEKVIHAQRYLMLSKADDWAMATESDWGQAQKEYFDKQFPDRDNKPLQLRVSHACAVRLGMNMVMESVTNDKREH
jgi:hypothetical protein